MLGVSHIFNSTVHWVLALMLLATSGIQAQEEVGASGNIDTKVALGAGDRITITVFNQDDLSGQYTLDEEGRFSMPLIGAIEAMGLTPAELEQILLDKFKPDYLVNPRIFVQLMELPVYYLVGEVAGRGAFPFEPDMTYLRAVAKAGGFSYRAKQEFVYVIRANDPEQEELKLSVDEKVQPGDIIRIDERMF